MIDQQQVRQIVRDEINSINNNAQFGVVPTPAHSHTGVDSAPIDGGNLVGAVLARLASIGTTATPTPPGQGVDLFDIYALSGSASFQAPNGKPVNGSLLRIRVTSSNAATARALTFATGAGGYIANSPALPTATTTGKTTNLGFEFDTSNSVNKWRLIWSANS